MTLRKLAKIGVVVILCVGLASCGSRRSRVLTEEPPAGTGTAPQQKASHNRDTAPTNYDKSSIMDILRPNRDDQTVKVNRFIWNASLDVLNFLPVQSVDPFTGLIVTGYGTPPGGGRSYRATIYITDPALDARSLQVALQSRGGRPVSAATSRAVENAILSRARQMRIAANKF